MLEEEILPIDRILAEWICPDGTKEAQSVICFLSAAAREGHLCVERGRPDPLSLFPGMPQMRILIDLGFDKVPDHPALVKDNGKLYFARHYHDQRAVYEQIDRISSAPIAPLPGEEAIETLPLLSEQKQAALHVFHSPLTLITGGPGTGKTTTCAQLIQTLLSYDPELEIAIAAPTGKAAMHLERSLNSSKLKGKTLHSLLSGPLPLSADLILVDESSMIDASMMALLLKGVKSGARLVLLGDPYQLPPVGAGALFSDLAQRGDNVVELKSCMRTELASILEFASAVKEGDITRAMQTPLKPLPSPQDVVQLAAPLLEQGSCCLLSPMRKGPYGVDALNALFLEHFLKSWDKSAPFRAPIMIAANSKRLELANGEVGVLVRQKGVEPSLGDAAYFGERKIPAALLPRFEYAWALSVHKSQGSEFDKVVLLLPEGSQNFGRKVLYTGATRARKALEIWGSEEVLRETILREGDRVSGVCL